MATPTAPPPQGPSYAPPRRASCRSPNPVVDGLRCLCLRRWVGARMLAGATDLVAGHREQSWTVLGADWLAVIPGEAFLAHLTDQRRS